MQGNIPALKDIRHHKPHEIFDWDNVKLVGEGNFSAVYRATCLKKPAETAVLEVGTDYAVKVTDKEKLTNPHVLKNLIHEIEILRKLASPYCVKLYDVFQSQTEIFLVLEWVPGGQLFEVISQRKHLSEQGARDVTKQLVEALVYLHGENIVHRDLKAENIMIDPNTMQIKIVDFGFAKFCGCQDQDYLLSTALTTGGLSPECSTPMTPKDIVVNTPIGTHEYLAPEILLSLSSHGISPRITTRSDIQRLDIFALGVNVYVMLGGMYPFYIPKYHGLTRKPSKNSLITQIEKGISFPDGRFGHVSEEAKDFCRWLLHPKRKSRPLAIDIFSHPWLTGDIQDTMLGPIEFSFSTDDMSDAWMEVLREMDSSFDESEDVDFESTVPVFEVAQRPSSTSINSQPSTPPLAHDSLSCSEVTQQSPSSSQNGKRATRASKRPSLNPPLNNSESEPALSSSSSTVATAAPSPKIPCVSFKDLGSLQIPTPESLSATEDIRGLSDTQISLNGSILSDSLACSTSRRYPPANLPTIPNNSEWPHMKLSGPHSHLEDVVEPSTSSTDEMTVTCHYKSLEISTAPDTAARRFNRSGRMDDFIDVAAVKSFGAFHTKKSSLDTSRAFRLFWSSLLLPWNSHFWRYECQHSTEWFLFSSAVYLFHTLQCILYALDLLGPCCNSDNEMYNRILTWNIYFPVVFLVASALGHAQQRSFVPKQSSKYSLKRRRGTSSSSPERTTSLSSLSFSKIPYAISDDDGSDYSEEDSEEDSEDDCEVSSRELNTILSVGNLTARSLKKTQEPVTPRNSGKVSVTLWQSDGTRRKSYLTLDEVRQKMVNRANAVKHNQLYALAPYFISIIISCLPLLYHMAFITVSSFKIASATEIFTFDVESFNKVSDPIFLGRMKEVATTTISNESDCLLNLGFLSITAMAATAIMTFAVFQTLAETEYTFCWRLSYARCFKALTSLTKSQEKQLPHFSLKDTQNIKFWLALRGGRPWLSQQEHQRMADSVLSNVFVIWIFLTALILMEAFSDLIDFPVTLVHWEMIFWLSALGLYLLRFLVLGSKVNDKYTDHSILLTEQMNVHLRILRASDQGNKEKKDRLVISDQVLRLVVKLLKELGKPSQVSGLPMNETLYNVARIVLLSALSAALSDAFGFNLRLSTLLKFKG